MVGLGGSVIVPGEINAKLLASWVSLLRKYSRTHKFIVVVGGGKIARNYQNAAKKIGVTNTKERDWLGIYATRLNAELVRSAFGSLASEKIIDSEDMVHQLVKPVTIACGWTPGWSTDYIAAFLAHRYGTSGVIMAGKPSHIYDKNPDIYKSAKKFSNLSWNAYKAIVPKKWVPGASVPIDPICAQFCERKKIPVFVMDGKNLKNIARFFEGKESEGTIIQ